jgi:site-specific DNA-methyltransferase (adenine-specific)
MKVTDKITITNEDNMLLMARYPDNYFDLAIVDPPYGINADKKNNGANSDYHLKNSKAKINNYKTGWDSNIPSDAYFNELKRVSKKQIIWGANFFGLKGGYLYWHKNVTMPTYSTGELAWLSWLNKLDFLNLTWHGMLQHDMNNKETRIHPTQKPVALYKWILDKYAKENDKILDTHLGSGSIAIACHDYGFELTACELDKEYYDKAIQRIKNHTNQQKLF